MPWTTVAPALPTEVLSAASALSQGAGLAREGIQTARTVMTAQTALVRSDLSGALGAAQALLDGAVTALEGAINGLINDAGAYVLIVPLPKKGLAYYLPQPMTLPPEAPTGALNRRVGTTVNQLPTWRRAFDASQLFTGGNAHFLKTVANSLTDAGDGARPQFSRTSYWGYAALVAGATDIAAATTVAAYVDNLFSRDQGSEQTGSGAADLDLVANGVTVRPSGNATLAVVEWTPLQSHPIEGEWLCAPWKYAVIRSESPEAMTARRVLDLFSTLDLTEGMTGRFGAKVLKLATWVGVVSRYVDESTLTPNQTYYYHLAVRTRVEGPNNQRTERPFSLLSSAVRYRPTNRAAPQGRRGVPPDWYRTPSVLQIIPPLGRLTDQMFEAIGSLRSSTTQTLGYANTALASLDKTLDRLTRMLSELDQIVSQLNAVYATPNANVHVILRDGQGDAMSVLGDLASNLDAQDDPNRPAFDGGDEYVCGMVAIVAAPSEAAFRTLWEMLQRLFGGSTTTDPILAGIESVQGALGVVRTTLTETTPSLTFNEDMSPRPAGEGDASCE